MSQIAIYLIPLVSVGYLARVIGVEGFALIGLASAVGLYVTIVVDWGFGYTGVQMVSAARSDAAAVSKIIFDITIAKIFLIAICLAVVLTLLPIFVKDSTARYAILISTFGQCLGGLSVDWALRGLEKFGKNAAVSLFGRIIVVPLYFLLVRNPNDVLWALAIQVGAGVLTCISSWYLILRLKVFQTTKLSASSAIEQMRSGLAVFASQLAYPVSAGSAAFLLSGLSTTMQLGIFSAAEKMRLAASRALSPTSMVFFSQLSHVAGTNEKEMPRKYFRSVAIHLSIASFVALVMILFSDLIVLILLGSQYTQAIVITKILSLSLLTNAGNTCINQFLMLPLNKKKCYWASVFSGAIATILVMPPLVYLYGAVGAAVAFVVADATSLTVGIVLALMNVHWVRASTVKWRGGLIQLSDKANSKRLK